MLKIIMIPLACLILSSCDDYKVPDSWTVRSDCRFSASQRNEDFSISEWIEKINKEEGKSFGICLSPSGAASVTNKIKQLEIDLDACKASH